MSTTTNLAPEPDVSLTAAEWASISSAFALGGSAAWMADVRRRAIERVISDRLDAARRKGGANALDEARIAYTQRGSGGGIEVDGDIVHVTSWLAILRDRAGGSLGAVESHTVRSGH